MKTKPGDDESPAPERDQKRPRLTPSDAVDAPPPPPPLGPLPAELWADVIDSLDLGEMIRACLISRSFLREVIPRVTEIEVDHADQMRAFVGRRFSGVTVLRIGCLFEYYDYEHEDDNPDLTINYDAVHRASPFLSSFAELGDILFLGTAFLPSVSQPDSDDDSDDEDEEGGESTWTETQVTLQRLIGVVKNSAEYARELVDEKAFDIRYLVRSIGGLFSSCAIRQTAHVTGLLEMPFCPRAGYSFNYSPNCIYCNHICNSFPCEQLVEILAGSNVAGCNDGGRATESEKCICLSTDKAVALLRRRPEGRKLLKSPYYLIASLINEEYEYIRALVRVVGLPEMTRAEVEEELARWHEDGYQKPTIPLDIFKMLTKGGIPLERSDFGKIHGEEED